MRKNNTQTQSENNRGQAFLPGISSDQKDSFPSIEKMVENTLEIEFGKDFTKQAGFDKMVEKIAQAIKYDPELNQEAQAVINKFKSDDQKDQQSYYNSARPHRRSH